MSDLYLALAVTTDNSDEPGDDRPNPTTRFTASVETVDNDFLGHLLGCIAI